MLTLLRKRRERERERERERDRQTEREREKGAMTTCCSSPLCIARKREADANER